MNPLVTTEWLAAHLNEVRVADASWYMPEDRRDPAAEFEAAHIPGAVFFDIEALSDHATDLPHMLPSAARFADNIGALGISNADTVVVYDGAGVFSAPRAWWMFRVMGHEKVFVLDGGLPKWKREGRPLAIGKPEPRHATFVAKENPALLRDFTAVLAAVKAHAPRIVDARSAARFSGTEKEPRPGLKSGHMPGAANVPYRSLLTPEGTFKPDADLRTAFAGANVDPGKPVIATCGSGVSAAILMLALNKIGAPAVSLYDGSWAEWGGRTEAPVETG